MTSGGSGAGDEAARVADGTRIAEAARAGAFIARWSAPEGAERASYAPFLSELRDLVGVERPRPATSDAGANACVVERAVGLDGVRLHDLRHTYASFGAGSGFGLPVIGELLGHAQAATTQRYAHLADDPLRHAAGRVAGAVSEAMGEGQVGEGSVTRLRSHATR